MHFSSTKAYLSWQLSRATKSSFVRSTSSLMLYTVAGQLITVVFSLVLTRIYSPREFGLFGVFLSFPALVGNLTCLNYNLAIPAPVRDEDGAAIAFGAAAIGSALSFVLSLIFLCLVLTNQLGYGVLPAWSWLLVWVILFITGISATLQYWCIRQQKLRQLGESVVAQNSIRALAQGGIGLVFAHWTVLGLGEIAGRAAQLVRFLMTSRTDLRRFHAVARYRTVLRVLLRYKRFVTILLPPSLLESAWGAMPAPLLSLLFGVAVTGQYYLMSRVLDLPAAFISRTVADAFYAKISAYARSDPSRIRPMLVAVFIALTGSSAIIFAPLIIFGPTIFSIVFGTPWAQAGLLAAIMTPGMMMQIGTSPVSRVFGITRKTHLRYPYTVMKLLGGATVFAAAWFYHLSIVWTVAGLALVNVSSYVLYIVTAYIAAGDVDPDDEIPADKIQTDPA